jgi:hypothetical protein
MLDGSTAGPSTSLRSGRDDNSYFGEGCECPRKIVIFSRPCGIRSSPHAHPGLRPGIFSCRPPGCRRFVGFPNTSPSEKSPLERFHNYGGLKKVARSGFSWECYCVLRLAAKACRFCGRMRITPPRGLSMSAMRRKEIDTASGKTTDSTRPLPCIP